MMFHEEILEMDLSLNHLLDRGTWHLATLISTLPNLKQLHIAAVGMESQGLRAVCAQVCTQKEACLFIVTTVSLEQCACTVGVYK